MANNQETVQKLVEGLNAAFEQEQNSDLPSTATQARVKTPEYVSNFGPPVSNTPSHSPIYAAPSSDAHHSSLNSEAELFGEDMTEIEGGESSSKKSGKERPQTSLTAPGFTAPFPNSTSNTVVDLRLAVEWLYESHDYYAASRIREVGRQLYPNSFDDTLLTIHRVPNAIPAQPKTICANYDAVDLLKSAWRNASALEGGRASEMVKQAVEDAYYVGILDEVIRAWEDAKQLGM